MAHSELLAEITTVLQPRIVVEVANVRRAVEYLIDKDYLVRSEADREVYVYVP